MSQQVTWNFNPPELSTWQEAREMAGMIDAFRLAQGLSMGGGVKPETKDAGTSGIYVPSWSGGPGGFPEPNDAENERFWLHFRFWNGRTGINVGLIYDLLRRYGGNQMYVFYTVNNNDLR